MLVATPYSWASAIVNAAFPIAAAMGLAIPFWAARMDDQAVYMGHVAENLEYQLSEYLTGGRFFAGIVIHEGEEMVKMVDDLMGDHILTFGSDYPHSESRFPESVDKVMSWDSLTPERARAVASRARQRILAEHTYRRRAFQFSCSTHLP